jgi:hypothetical protein
MLNAECQMRNEVRAKAVWGSRLKSGMALAVSCAALLPLTSCSDAVRASDSSSYLILESITGPGNVGVVQSDVLPAVQDTGTAAIQVAMKDPQGPAPTPVNSITITQYHVQYVRSDGHNVQGVDVPFAFDSGVTQTIAAGTTGNVTFTLVRLQAKLEAPLQALANKGGQIVISTIAQVTFYGQDQSGRAVSVTGNIEVNFADWPN